MSKKALSILIITIIIIASWFSTLVFSSKQEALQTQSAAAKEIAPEITTDGAVTSANIATLHFQAGGKMTALYAKEGDKVYAGQSIAQLDTYALQQQLTAALNTYRSTRDSYDQANQNANTNNILQNTQRGQLNFYGAGVGTDQSSTSYLQDVVQRVLDQNQANLDNSVVNVQLANYALQMATLTSPINGIITHEDVNTSNVNVTPATTFVVSDPSNLVFKANIPQYQIDFVHVGSSAIIRLDGVNGRKFTGTISKIYPQKITLPNGQQVYKVDITSDGLLGNATFDQTGSVTITSDATRGVFLVPAWTITNHQFIWVEENGKPVLKKVTIGSLHGNDIEVQSGLSEKDLIILNPQAIASGKYTLL